jgi:hypothetical protein
MSFPARFSEALSTVQLSPGDQKIVLSRFIPLVSAEEWNCWLYRILDTVLTNIVLVGAILVASFLAFTDPGAFNDSVAAGFKWTCWGITLAIAIAKQWQSYFNISKKFILGTIMVEKLHAEGWAFVAGSGRYDGLIGETRVKTFMVRIERLKAKSIESQPEMGQDNSLRDLLAGASISAANSAATTPTINLAAIADSITATKGAEFDEVIEAAIAARKKMGLSDSSQMLSASGLTGSRTSSQASLIPKIHVDSDNIADLPDDKK